MLNRCKFRTLVILARSVEALARRACPESDSGVARGLCGLPKMKTRNIGYFCCLRQARLDSARQAPTRFSRRQATLTGPTPPGTGV